MVFEFLDAEWSVDVDGSLFRLGTSKNPQRGQPQIGETALMPEFTGSSEDVFCSRFRRHREAVTTGSKLRSVSPQSKRRSWKPWTLEEDRALREAARRILNKDGSIDFDTIAMIEPFNCRRNSGALMARHKQLIESDELQSVLLSRGWGNAKKRSHRYIRHDRFVQPTAFRGKGKRRVLKMRNLAKISDHPSPNFDQGNLPHSPNTIITGHALYRMSLKTS
jgi:hypothetical protein